MTLLCFPNHFPKKSLFRNYLSPKSKSQQVKIGQMYYSAISSISATKGWAIATASFVPRSPRSPSMTKKKESLNIVLSGDVPYGSFSLVKEVLVSGLYFSINQSFHDLERDFVCCNITNILFVYKSIVVRLCSNEVKTMGIESRKLLSNSLHPPSKKAVSSDNPFFTWKMFVSVHKDPQDKPENCPQGFPCFSKE